MDQASTLAPVNRLATSQWLPRGNIPQKLQLFFVHMFGDDGGNWLADHLLGRVAVEILRIFVPGPDDACEIAAHDGNVGGRHEGRHLPSSVLGLGAKMRRISTATRPRR